MSREFNVIIERDVEDYYVGSVPALRRCHTQAPELRGTDWLAITWNRIDPTGAAVSQARAGAGHGSMNSKVLGAR